MFRKTEKRKGQMNVAYDSVQTGWNDIRERHRCVDGEKFTWLFTDN